MRKILKQWWEVAPGSLVATILILASTAGVVVYFWQGPEPGKVMLIIVVGWILFVGAVVHGASMWDLGR